jgi:hypothetical protein
MASLFRGTEQSERPLSACMRLLNVWPSERATG